MAVLRSLLAIYGALDQAVKDSRGVPEIAATVDGFLPGSPSHQGWYAEIENFLFGVVPNGPDDMGAREVPDLSKAVDDIKANASRLTNPEKSRLVYGVGAVAHLEIYVQEHFEQFAEVLALAGPKHRTGSKFESLRDIDSGQQLLNLLCSDFNSLSDWESVTTSAVEAGLLAESVQKVPLCHAAVVTIDDVPCVVVDTDCWSTDACLDDVKAAVDPRNWHDNYPAFFCAMAPQSDRPDSWSRVLETVGVCDIPWSRRLLTELKYYKSEQEKTAVRLDYDLHDPWPGTGDGQVEVDRGFVSIWELDGDPEHPRVRAKSRKVCRIRGLSPYAQARWVCILGYGDAFYEFLFRPKPKPAKFPWQASPPPPTALTTSVAATPATPPSNGDAISSAITFLTEYVDNLTTKSLNLSEKWFSGQLNFKDLADFSEGVAGQWAASPWRFLQKLSQSGTAAERTSPSEGGLT